MATFDLGRVTPIYKGDYDAEMRYELNDIVKYNGSIYWHYGAVPTGAETDPTNESVWSLLFTADDVRTEILGFTTRAETAAESAGTSAETATTKANAASSSASAAATSETNAANSASTASTKAAQATTAASTATTKASEASASASTASNKASEAAQSATDANSYKTAAQTAKTAAETAQSAAETAAASVSTSAAQIETNRQDIGAINESLDDVKADLADVANHPVKSAEQLISDKRTTDKVPYKYRASASGKSDRAYDMIVGGTVCFNQLVGIRESDISKTENGVTFTDNRDGTYTVSTDANGATAQTNLYVSSSEYADTANHVFFACGSPSNASGNTYLLYTNTNILSDGKVYKSNVNVPRLRIIVKAGAVITTPVTFKPQLFDLTAMFGTTIADHIYSLEQSTAGTGVALFRAMFSNDYYPYSAGGLVSVEGLSAHVMRDADDNIIASYPLDNSLTLRGVLVLKDGKIEFDGDTYEADGTVTRRYGVVDFGTLNWSYNINSNNFYSSGLSSAKGSLNANTVGNIICNKYISDSDNHANDSAYDKIITVNSSTSTSRILSVRDSNYTDATEFKTAMSGVYLVYELATPTTEEATPYASTQIVSPYGTEEYISETVCPVGHVTEYPDNLRAKIDGLPWDLSMIAPVEVAYTATRNYTVNQLLIVDNTLYKATANIANGGTITVGTNVISTTLSEVIASLS